MRKILLLLWAIVAMAVMACEENNTSYGSTFEEIDSEIIDSSPATVEISEECIAAAGMTEMKLIVVRPMGQMERGAMAYMYIPHPWRHIKMLRKNSRRVWPFWVSMTFIFLQGRKG